MTKIKKTGVITISSPEELIHGLEITKMRGALHSLFHHTNTKAFANMVKSGSIWMSRIGEMNDETEVFKDAARTYAFCLSAKSSENVGMWIAYGLPRRDAIRIRFPGKALRDFLRDSDWRVSVYPVKNNEVQSKPVSGTVSLQYVGYISRDGQRVHVRDVIYRFPPEVSMSRAELMERCGSFIKRLGWEYEHEIRLVVHLEKKITAQRIELRLPEVFKEILTDKSEKQGKSGGKPSVIVGPWSGRAAFVKKFCGMVKELDCAGRDDVKYFLAQAADEGGLIRESEYVGKIRLGHCYGCEKIRSCECDYCEGVQK